MPTKPIERLLFAQGGACYFCQKQLSFADASIEHLHARANGGDNSDDNCVVCCKALNHLLGRMSLKEKLRVVLNQKGSFKCPNGAAKAKVATASADENMNRVLIDLRKRDSARPGTLKTLASTISNLFQKRLTDSQINALVNKLKAQGIVTLTGTKVTYKLPNAAT